MVKGMANIVMKNSLAVLLLAGVCLTGCHSKSDIVITEENALEVALDEAGYKQDEVTSVSVEKKDSQFDVYFDIHSGRYHVVVSDEGLVDSFAFEKGASSNEEKVPEKKEEEKEQDAKSEFDKKPLVKDGLSEEQIAKKVSEHLGISEYVAKDFKFEMNADHTQCTVTIKVENSGNSIVVIDVKSGIILSTLINQ